jgi:hypothetical protein
LDNDTLEFGDFLNMDVRDIAASMHHSGVLTIEIDPDQRIPDVLLPQQGRAEEQ